MIESNQGDNGGEQWSINVVVVQDGSDHFSTIAYSLNACPKNKTIAYVIYVKRGKHEERVVIPKGEKVFMYGDGPAHTNVNGTNTREPKIVTTSFRAATFGVLPKYFNSEWSVAQFHLQEGSHYTVAFGLQKNTVIILGMDGSFYRCQFDPVHGGEMTQLEYHNFLKPEPETAL